MRSFQNVRRISFLLPAGMAMIVLVIAGMSVFSSVQKQLQTKIIEEVSHRDAVARSAALTMSGAAEAINSRLLGVLADVYSASGSVNVVEQRFAEFEASWKTLTERMPEDRRSHLADAEAGVKMFRTVHSSVISALKTQDRKVVAKVYDGFIEQVVPFRRNLTKLANLLDENVAEELRLLSHASNQALMLTLLGSGFAVLIGLFVATYAVFGVVRPINRVIGIVGELKSGRTEVAIPQTGRVDEIGILMTALESFRFSIESMEALRAEQKQLALLSEQGRKDLLSGLVTDLDLAVGSSLGSIANANSKLTANAESLTVLANATKSSATDVTVLTDSALDGLEAAAIVSAEMTTSIEEITQRVTASSVISGEAMAQAEATGGVITELENAIGNIATVLDFIRAIASQTNLLALNATIEAARAGEAGRGFAVVASEVKELATQTAKATDEIASHIASIRSAGSNTTSAIAMIRATLGRVTELASEIAVAVQEQKRATTEVAARVDRASTDAEKIGNAIKDVTERAAVTGLQADAVFDAVNALTCESKVLRQNIERFVIETRAA